MFSDRSANKYCHPCFCLTDTFSTSRQLLNGFWFIAKVIRYIPLETAALFFLANPYLKQGIGKVYVMVDFICMGNHTKMKSGLHMDSPCAAHWPLWQWAAQWTGAAHYLFQRIIISAHGLHTLLPTYFQSHYNIWPWAAHRQLRLLNYIVGSSNLNDEKEVGSGQFIHSFHHACE